VQAIVFYVIISVGEREVIRKKRWGRCVEGEAGRRKAMKVKRKRKSVEDEAKKKER
jgi:hypothetical protein